MLFEFRENILTLFQVWKDDIIWNLDKMESS